MNIVFVLIPLSLVLAAVVSVLGAGLWRWIDASAPDSRATSGPG